MPSDAVQIQIERAAATIRQADALLIGAGAGMGVDSGLPDFRGDEGFWHAYPPFRRLNLSFYDLANPVWFRTDPPQAWGFYGHRRQLYRAAVPHDGFELLRRWGDSKPRGCFVFTSNVDGQFQKAGFPAEQIVECHGSIHHLQCARPCGDAIWEAGDFELHIDPETFRADAPLPECPHCGALARPNVLMFGDSHWVPDRTREQLARYRAWLGGLRGARLVVVECGAGTAVPSVRHECQRGGTLIRINPREPQAMPDAISLPLGALDALTRIDAVE